ncbi:LCP family protein [Faecalicatena sp. AGMB00832]|uniref:LCP family protein n=1 Tax=Faecalicatena faecalis TaxID=2726362 RepID=A0ABS6CZP2_9FIRM|nr:LCP family protein [Faecalicatena faecalis]MBU3874733.1 LCP family protein [Faecalicatena faecalis]
MVKKRNRRRRRRAQRGFMAWALWKKVLAIAGGTLVLLTTAGVAFAASKLGKLETTTLDTDKLNISTEIEHNETGYLNVALFGLDSRDGSLSSGERSDTIIIASLNRQTKEVKLCSVFRDTLLQQPDGSYNKANAAYSTDDAEGAIAMLNKNLDMDIQHYVTVNFNALVDVIDELGGIELDLTGEEVFWTNGYCTETSRVTGKSTTELTKPGKQLLDGVQATSYCRIRYTQGDDFKRAERQRTVLQEVVNKAQKADLSTINRIIDKVFPKIATNFTLTEILAYAKDAFDYSLTEMEGFPFDKTTATLTDVGSSVIPEGFEDNVTKLHNFFFGNDGYTPSSIVKSIGYEIQSYTAGNVTDEDPSVYEIPEESYYYGENSGATTENNDSTYTSDAENAQNGSTLPENGSTNSSGGETTEIPETGTDNEAGFGDNQNNITE